MYSYSYYLFIFYILVILKKLIETVPLLDILLCHITAKGPFDFGPFGTEVI